MIASTRKTLAITALALALAGAGTAALACDGHGKHDRKGPPSPEKHLERLSEKLGLSDAQRAQAKVIIEAEHGKREAAREESKAALAKILTKEQLEKFEQMRQRGPRDDGDAPEGDAPPPR